jgi:ring-1,2-phenylacetyl-CoA epoxidase subunit PaaE
MSAHFHSVKVIRVRRETKDCVSIAFDVPQHLRALFSFTAGQYVNLRVVVDGEELRRSYSLCSTPHSGEWCVAVKRVEGGRFSEYANTKLQTGDTIDVMPPDGKFCFEPDQRAKRHVLAIAAGSGITPIFSIVTTLLEREPLSQLTLIYGNRRVRDIIFKEAIEDLRDRFLSRFQLVHVLSQEPQESPIAIGRIRRENVLSICDKLASNAKFNRAYVCGPIGMTDEASLALRDYGLEDAAISRELFAAVGVAPLRAAAQTRVRDELVDSPAAQVVVIADGIERTLRVPLQGQTILEAARAAGIDAPFACKAGVCCTCRAQVLAGSVRMDANYTLEQHEMNRGFVLTCQAHPTTERVVVSFDAR